MVKIAEDGANDPEEQAFQQLLGAWAKNSELPVTEILATNFGSELNEFQKDEREYLRQKEEFRMTIKLRSRVRRVCGSH